MAEATKILYGQAWVNDGSLWQDQIVVTGLDLINQTIKIIDDIWEDLLSDEGTYKTNGKGYFYWEINMTDVGDDSIINTVFYECPKPDRSKLTDEDDNLLELNDVSGDYATYWLQKFITATDNYETSSAIQKKEITFPGTSYIAPTSDGGSEVITLAETKIQNTDIGDISNLLSSIF